ncbi:DUF1127 domain-containing protein [Roseococcus sp. SYP-B2431]|uniref:DUF1127 domain-containing protein n=1 Tax=Roseococcus sp. SYP-B2431 TaxID=2496640 RepID=UPI001F0F49AB|nr:DUF1127 domain-containing protein [Roseococcus sp. SYP-B2431]
MSMHNEGRERRFSPRIRPSLRREEGSHLVSIVAQRAHRLRARAMRMAARRALRRLLSRLRRWRQQRLEAQELAALSDRELRDMGVTRYDARHEAREAYWWR